MRVVRNIAIIALLAAAVSFLPGGGAVAEAVFQALTLAFLAAIAWTAYRFLRANEFTLLAMPERSRGILFGAIGLLVLTVAGTATLWSSGLGTFTWLLLLGGSVVAIWRVWVEARAD